jgi:hypothetical protein
MLRKTLASSLAMTGLLIGFGAFGHSFMGRHTLDVGLARRDAGCAHRQAGLSRLVLLRRLHAGFRCADDPERLAGHAWQRSGVARFRTDRRVLPADGVLALAYMGEPFWSVFVLLGCLALILSVALALPARATASRHAPLARTCRRHVSSSARITSCTGAACAGRYSKLSSSM